MHIGTANFQGRPLVTHKYHPFQQAIVSSKHSRKVIAGSRRIGKTFGLALMAVEQCTSRKRFRVLILGPTYRNVKNSFWSTFETMIPQGHAKFSKHEMKITFLTGSTIHLMGMDNPDNARGFSPSPNLIIIDEFGFFKEGAYDYVVSPMLADVKAKADLVVIGTPNGEGDKFHNLYLKGMDDKESKWMGWHQVAWDCRPDMRNYLREQQDNLPPEVYEQEFDARFTTMTGRVFNYMDPIHSIVLEEDEQLERGDPVHISIDFNVRIMASTVFLIRNGNYYGIDEYYGAANTDMLIEWIKRDYGDRQVFVYPDPTGNKNASNAAIGVTDIKKLSTAGFRVREKGKVSQRDSANCVNALLMSASGKTTMFFDQHKCKRTILSLKSTMWKQKAGTVENETPEIDKSKGTEHFSDGIRYMAWFLSKLSTRGLVRVVKSNYILG